MSDLLQTIVAATERITAVRAGKEPLAALRKRAELVPPRPGAFSGALGRGDRVNVIAECKRRSPSKGVLRADYDPVAIARGYAAHGAAAISVLTEPTFFDGTLDHLRAVRAAVPTPLLRKDFVVTEYQIAEAAAIGANAVLLIVAALDDRDLARLRAYAAQRGLATLVEVHDADELAKAVDAGADVIGVNSRNLRTLTVDPSTLDDLGARIPTGVLAVAESGLKTPEDLRRLAAIRYDAFLIGERFMTADDPGAAMGALRTAVEAS